MLKNLVYILTLIFMGPCAQSAELSSSGYLIEEVLSQTKDPKEYDWRRIPLQVHFTFFNVLESNIFEARSYQLGLTRSLSGPWSLRGALRRTSVVESSSSRMIAQTVFSQAGQPSRYEILAGAGFTLLDGRTATALSPRTTDLGHALTAHAGLVYSKYDSKDPAPISGMRAVYNDLSIETGLRFQIFLPQSLGLGFEWAYGLPLSGRDPDLPNWQRIGGSVSWAFGQRL